MEGRDSGVIHGVGPGGWTGVSGSLGGAAEEEVGVDLLAVKEVLEVRARGSFFLVGVVCLVSAGFRREMLARELETR